MDEWVSGCVHMSEWGVSESESGCVCAQVFALSHSSRTNISVPLMSQCLHLVAGPGSLLAGI